jgi:nitrite reductase/ring-hydroxylating ferredoxin subunit
VSELPGSDSPDGLDGLDGVDAGAPVGSIVPAVVDGTAMAVVRHDAGWTMVEDRCPHGACPFTLEGEVFDGTVLACNCHGSEFDLVTGAVLLGPAQVPLTCLPLEPDDDSPGLRRRPI